jgi:UDP-N-acetylmuramyl pentapeptide phosphotransferase/UDP-N-acetylglucosamine-1-phosphate transferase
MRTFVHALPHPDGTVQHAAWAPLVSFATALILTGGLLKSRWARLALDHPNRRSLHLEPVPRVGGVGVLVGIAVAAIWVEPALPARVFLGDVGAVPLGFLASALGLAGWAGGAWTWWFPLLVFSPFIADATVTLLRRLARRERVWEAHYGPVCYPHAEC